MVNHSRAERGHGRAERVMESSNNPRISRIAMVAATAAAVSPRVRQGTGRSFGVLGCWRGPQPGAIGDRHVVADRSMAASALLCPAGRSVPSRGGPERWRRPRPGIGASGTRWVHAEPAGQGVQRSPAVTSGSDEPQVKPLTQPRPGRASGGGPEFESPAPRAIGLGRNDQDAPNA